MNFFPSRWPIMCAIMNGVSDLNLALAVHEAGAMPSLININSNNNIRCEQLDRDLTEFVKCTGQANIVLQLDYADIQNIQFVNLIRKHKVSHIEVFGAMPSDDSDKLVTNVLPDPMWNAGYKLVRQTSKIIFRTLQVKEYEDVDAYALKGSDAAGFTGKISTKDLFDQQILKTPSIPLIAYGGVGTPEQVKYYIDRGAAGVAVGTLFAASKESCLDNTVKQKMIASDSKSLIKFNTTQQALVLGAEAEVFADTEPNRQSSLEKGIRGVGGHIYAGSSIDYITEIRSVKEIVGYLTDLLQ